MICSPLHPLMNLSFFVLGLTMIIGSALLGRRYKNFGSTIGGFSLFAIGGFGVLLVGLFPENTIPAFHGIGAALPFLIGNVGLVVIAIHVGVPTYLRIYTALSGAVALVALSLYATGHFVDLGEGGIERVVAYPQTIWMIVLGIYAARTGDETLRT